MWQASGVVWLELRTWYQATIFKDANERNVEVNKLAKIVRRRLESWYLLHVAIFGQTVPAHVHFALADSKEINFPFKLALVAFSWAVSCTKRWFETRLGPAAWLSGFANYTFMRCPERVFHNLLVLQPGGFVGLTALHLDSHARLHIENLIAPGSDDYHEYMKTWNEFLRNPVILASEFALTNPVYVSIGELLAVLLLQQNTRLRGIAHAILMLMDHQVALRFVEITDSFDLSWYVPLAGPSGKKRRLDSEFKAAVLAKNKTVPTHSI